MKKYYFLIACLFLNLQGILGQEKTISKKVELNDDLNVVLAESRLLFPDYQDAIFYNDKGPGKAKMNYNMLTDEMMFINPDGDTLSLANPKDIRSILFGKREFVYTAKGFLEILKEDDITPKALLIGRRIRLADTKPYGVYGMASGVAAIDNFKMIRGKTEGLQIDSERIYVVDITYYLSVGKSLYVITSEKTFQKTFGKDKKELISQYIKDHELSMRKESDLIQLFNFCVQNK